MVQKPIKLSWLDRFAYAHFRKKPFLRWIWKRFFARRHALSDWQSIITFNIIWDKAIGANEDRLITLTSGWLHKAVWCRHPDGPEAAIDLVLSTIYKGLGWFAANWGPEAVPECFPLILKAATECAREYAQSSERTYIGERVFEARVREKLRRA